jgi:hypothetical protein
VLGGALSARKIRGTRAGTDLLHQDKLCIDRDDRARLGHLVSREVLLLYQAGIAVDRDVRVPTEYAFVDVGRQRREVKAISHVFPFEIYNRRNLGLFRYDLDNEWRARTFHVSGKLSASCSETLRTPKSLNTNHRVAALARSASGTVQSLGYERRIYVISITFDNRD